MNQITLQDKIDEIIKHLGNSSLVTTRHFFIGKNSGFNAAIIYISSLVNKQAIDTNILSPLMLNVDENISIIKDKAQYLCKSYIISSGIFISEDLNEALQGLKSGNTVLMLDGENEFIIVDTHGGKYRQISEPLNEASMKGPKEGFVEDIDTNISIIKRHIKDKNLATKNFTVGVRSQTRLALLYIDDIVDKDILNQLSKRINSIKVDFITSSGMIEQYIEEKTYTIFPQSISTERPDRIIANLMEGKIAIIIDGDPSVLTVPVILREFFNTVEDYYNRTVVASAVRLLRYMAVFITLFLSPIYLILIKFNSELIPIDFIVPIVQSRSSISLTPFMEILILEVFVELLREGGLRLPSKIAQTLSIVGGIIIGDAAVNSNMVSPTTLLVVGLTVVSSFLIPNYEMSLSIRLLRFPILVISNFTGILGVSASFMFILIHLSSLENYGVAYMTFNKNDLKDMYTRAPLWQMNERPTIIPNRNPIRQKDFRKRRDKSNE